MMSSTVSFKSWEQNWTGQKRDEQGAEFASWCMLESFLQEWERRGHNWFQMSKTTRGQGMWDHIRKYNHVCILPFSIPCIHTYIHTNLQTLEGTIEWFVCDVGAADWSHGGSNCLMVGFMETLYNAGDSLFSACQEEGICDTTMAGLLLESHVVMYPLFPQDEKISCNVKYHSYCTRVSF